MDGVQVAQLAQSVGLQGQNLQIAVAIANAESGFNERAVSSTNDYGLWQINKDWHPQYFPGGSNDQMFDPQANAAAMYEISGGGSNWNPWSTYTGGAYLPYMGDAATYISSIGNGTGGTLGDGSQDDRTTAAKVSAVMAYAQAQMGKPYEWGGNGPDTFDCSGLVQQAYASAGISIGRDVSSQALEGHEVTDRSQAAAADIVTMYGDEHCGLITDSGHFLNAPHTGDVVKISEVPWDSVDHLRRVIGGGSPSLWSQLMGGLGTIGAGLIGGPLAILGGATNPLTAALAPLQFLAKAGAWIANPHNTFRILQGLGGFVAIIMGLYITAQAMGVGPSPGQVAKVAALAA